MEEQSLKDDWASVVAGEYLKRYEWADYDALKLFHQLRLVNDTLTNAANRVQKPFLPDARAWRIPILRALYMSPKKSLSHAEISEEIRLPLAHLTYQIDKLHKADYVRSLPHQSDRRITLVELTPSGEEVCEGLFQARTRLITDLGSIFSPEEKQTLNDMLQRLREAAEAWGGGTERPSKLT